jgi:hypothetical protein
MSKFCPQGVLRNQGHTRSNSFLLKIIEDVEVSFCMMDACLYVHEIRQNHRAGLGLRIEEPFQSPFHVF